MIDLPPELAALISAERAVTVASAAKVAVRAKLAASVGAAPLGSIAVGATLAGTGKALAIVAITLAAGGGAALALRDDATSTRAPTHAVGSTTRGERDVVPPPDQEPVHVVAPEPVVVAASELVATPVPVSAPQVVVASSKPVSIPTFVVVASPKPMSAPVPVVVAASSADRASVPVVVAAAGADRARATSLPNEPARAPGEPSAADADPAVGSISAVASPQGPSQVVLVRAAWAALSIGNAARALALADEDSRSRVQGRLAEERDAVRVVALARLHRSADARRASSRFLALYPTSVHRALIERALADEESR